MRKKRAGHRQRTPDPKYNDVLVAEFINNIMKQGKKHLARRVLYDAFALIEERTKAAGLDVFKKAVSNTRPVLEVKARRVGGATYQVPTEVRSERSTALAIRWLRIPFMTGRWVRPPLPASGKPPQARQRPATARTPP